MKFTGLSPARLNQLKPELENFCREHPISRLEVFGSVARGEATEESDLDLLVTFAPGTPQGMAQFAFVDDLERNWKSFLAVKLISLSAMPWRKIRIRFGRN